MNLLDIANKIKGYFTTQLPAAKIQPPPGPAPVQNPGWSNVGKIPNANVQPANDWGSQIIRGYGQGAMNIIKPLATSFGQTLAQSYTKPMYAQANQELITAQQNLIRKAAMTADPAERQKLLKLSMQTNQVNQQVAGSQMPTYSNKDIAMSAVKTAGLALYPGQTAQMGLINPAFEAGGQVVNQILHKQPVKVNVDLQKSVASGTEFGAMLGPINAVTGFVLKPILSKLAPVALGNINTYLEMAQKATTPEAKSLILQNLAKLVVRNVGVKVIASTVGGMGYGATMDANTAQERIKNIFSQGLQFGEFTLAGEALNLGGQVAMAHLPKASQVPVGLSTKNLTKAEHDKLYPQESPQTPPLSPTGEVSPTLASKEVSPTVAQQPLSVPPKGVPSGGGGIVDRNFQGEIPIITSEGKTIMFDKSVKDFFENSKRESYQKLVGKTPEGKDIAIRLRTNSNGNTLEILDFSSGAKGKGYGTDLLNSVIEDARKSGIKNIIANDVRQFDASGYWAKQGFKDIGNANMELSLTPPQPKGVEVKPMEKVSLKDMPKVVQEGNQLQSPVIPQEVRQTPTSGQISPQDIIPSGMKERKFVTSVQESPNVTGKTKTGVEGLYTVKPDTKLMGEANVLLTEGASLDLKNVKNVDQKVAATIQEAINQDKAGNHDAAANLYNNLSKSGTELGRGVHAYSLLNQMSPEAIAISAAKKIQLYNETARVKIPEMTGDQQKMISDSVDAIKQMKEGRDKNFAIQKLNESIGRMVPSGMGDKIFAIWRTGLLTGLRTPGKILLSHTLSNVAEGASRIAATPFDVATSLITGKRSGVVTPRGLFAGLKTGTVAAFDNLVHGYETPGTGGIQRDFSNQTHFSEHWYGKVADAYVGTISRLHGSLYKPFFGSQHLNTEFDLATTEAHNQGLRGTEKEAFIQDFVKKATDYAVQNANVTESKLPLSTPEGAGIRANAEARYTTFQNKTLLSEIASGMKSKGGSANPTRYAIPFSQIPSSIAMKLVDYSPVGPIKEAVQQIKAGTFDQRALSQALGRATVGVGVMYLGKTLYDKGMMHLAYPTDKKTQDLWQLKGWKENSIDLGGKSRQLSSLGPTGDALIVGGAYAEGMKGNKKTVGSVGNAALGAGVTGVQTIGNSPYMQGLADISGLFSDPLGTAKTTAKSYVGSVVPTVVANVATATDPLQRQTNSFMDALISKVPGLRETLLPQVNVLGQNVQRGNSVPGSLFDPLYSSQNYSSPVIDELNRLNQTQNPATPSKLAADQTILTQKVKLTPQQLTTLQQGSGSVLSQQLNGLISNPSYQGLTDEQKASAINNLVSTQRTVFKNTNPVVPTITPSSVTTPPSTGTGLGKYVLVNKDTGTAKNVDLSTPITYPTLTGDTTIDKKLKAGYKTDINSRINDIISLYQDNQLTLDQAKGAILDLQNQSGVGTKKPKKLTVKGATIKLPKLSTTKSSFKPLSIKMPKMPTFKMAKAKVTKIKVAKSKVKKYVAKKIPSLGGGLHLA